MSTTSDAAAAGGGEAAAGEWVRQYDPSAAEYYFYNTTSGDVTWDQPAAWVDAGDGAPSSGGDPKLDAATKLQSLYRGKRARTDVEAAKSRGAIASALWVTMWDPSAGAWYFYNTHTEESTWDRPHDYVDGATDELCESVIKIQCLYRSRKARLVVQGKRVKASVGVAPETKAADSDVGDAAALADKTKSKAYGELNTTDTKGATPGTGSPWVEQFDPTHNAVYYYNMETGECTWDRPEGFVEGGESELMAATLKIQSMFRGHKARDDVQTRIAELKMRQGEVSDVVWVEQFDPTSGFHYYYNTSNGECTWEKPEGFVPGASNLLCDSALKIQSMFRSRKARLRVASKRHAAEAKALADKVKSDAYGELNAGDTKGRDTVWVKQFDPAHKADYYYNMETGECTWDKPEGFVEGGESELMAATVKVQNMFRGHKAREDVQERMAELKMRQGLANEVVWVEQFDPTHKARYYYNTQTGECTWTRPEDFVEGGSDTACQAALKIQCMFRGRRARAKVAGKRHEVEGAKKRAAAAAASAAGSGGGGGGGGGGEAGGGSTWLVRYDDEYQREYFFNRATEEVTWERPADFDGSERELDRLKRKAAVAAAARDSSQFAGKYTAASDKEEAAALRIQTAARGRQARKFVATGAGLSPQQLREQRAVIAKRDARLRASRDLLTTREAQLKAVSSKADTIRAFSFNGSGEEQLTSPKGTVDGDARVITDPAVSAAIDDAEVHAKEALVVLEEARRKLAALKPGDTEETVDRAEKSAMRALATMDRASMLAVAKFEAPLVDAWETLAFTRGMYAYRNAEARARNLEGLPRHLRDLRAITARAEASLRDFADYRDQDATSRGFRSAVASRLAKMSFFNVHKDGPAMIAAARRAFTQAERLSAESERSLMRLEEDGTKHVLRRRLVLHDELEYRKAFTALCRLKWAQGKRKAVLLGEPGAPRLASHSSGGDTGSALLASPTARAARHAADARSARERSSAEAAARRKREYARTAALHASAKLDASFNTPWEAAAGGSSWERLTRLMAEEKSRRENVEGQTDVNIVEMPDPDTGARLLHSAAWFGHVALVSNLIDEGHANVHRVDNPLSRQTPLHYAARGGSQHVVKELLACGARAYTPDGAGDTALHLAARAGHYRVVDALLPEDAFVSNTELEGRPLSAFSEFTGPLETWPDAWRTVGTPNSRGRRAADVAKTKGLRNRIRAAEQALAFRITKAQEFVSGATDGGDARSEGDLAAGALGPESPSPGMSPSHRPGSRAVSRASARGGRSPEARTRMASTAPASGASASRAPRKVEYTATGGFGASLTSGVARDWANRFRAMGGGN